MGLLVAFIAIAIVGQLVNVAVCLGLERFYPATVTIPTFFFLWVGVFWISWRLALRLTEPRTSAVISPEEQRLLAFLTTAAQRP